MKVKIFSHTDLDGVGSPILAIRAFGPENVDYVLCNYNEINEKVKEFILSPELEKFDRIFITDISVNEEVAELMNAIEESGQKLFLLFDHHSTATWLNKYSWAYVASEYEDDPLSPTEYQRGTAGTSLFYDWLTKNFPMHSEDWNAAQFAELVRCYDTWEWDRTGNTWAKQLNDLFYIIGPSRFIKRFSEDIDPHFNPSEVTILEVERNTIESYLKKKEKEAWKLRIDGYSSLILFAERYISELGNTLAKNHPEVDLVIIVDAGSGRVSYRTVKDNVNVAELAKKYGGGGHPKSSGSTFNRALACSWLFEVFDKRLSE